MRGLEMIAVMAILVTVIGSIIGGISGMMIAIHWVLRPLDLRAGQPVLERFRFRLIDGLCLAVQWQVLLACAVAMNEQSPSHLRGMPFVPALVLCGVLLAIGAGSISRLNQARIESSIRRSAFILLQPITMLAGVAFPIATVSLAVGGLQLCSLPNGSWADVAIPGAFLATAVALLAVSRLASQWVAAEA